MPKLIDETGNKYGRLLVLGPEKKYGRTYWRCKCDCGNEIVVIGSSLRNGNTKSCGCYQRERAKESNENRVEDIIGKKFNFLTVESFYGYEETYRNKRQRMYLCKCDCGKEKIVSYSNIKTGHVKSCGDLSHFQNYIDETGNKYGKLTVLSYEDTNTDGKARWRCRCDCGSEIITTGKSLRLGLIISCGCVKSKGEERIGQILSLNNYHYQKQYIFQDLKSENNYPLYFDFAIFDNDNNLQCVIEYQGEQHFNPGHGYWFFNFEKQQKNDNLKREYCKIHNIKLIEIPYTDYNKLNLKYLQEVMEWR